MFSQSEEEKYILEYFKDTTDGTFLSIGENDGETFSNVRALALSGKFKGVMVEPSPKAFNRLKNLYSGHKGFYVYPYAIHTHNGTAILQESGPLCNTTDISLVSSISVEEIKRWVHTKEPGQNWYITFDPVEVQCFRWKTFYNRLTIRTFDFVSIDCEGSDLDILKQMDLEAMKVRCICLEWNSKQELKTEYEKYLEGFELLYTSAENLLYGRR